MDENENQPLRIWDEAKSIFQASKATWQLVPWQHRASLMVASLIMAAISLGNITVALILGVLVDRVGKQLETEEKTALLTSVGSLFVALAILYLTREALNVLRRVLVERSCTRLNCDMQRRVVGHVMKFDMLSLVGEKIGTLHGKIFRSVDGLIHFVRLVFLDCVPAVLTGLFALTTAVYKQPYLGAIMFGVIPVSVWLTLKQLNGQKFVRLELMKDCEYIDGIVVEQLGGVEYIRVANTHEAESTRLGNAMEKRRKRELRHHFQMALYGSAKALNEGAFHILVLIYATYLAIHGQISVGDVLTFSILFLNVMAPLNEVHRVIDEGHESSLRLNDLLGLLNTPTDPSFELAKSSDNSEPAKVTNRTSHALERNTPLIQFDNVRVNYRGANQEHRPALVNVSFDIHPGETIGIAGPSGSGKSTCIKLMLRLLHANDGVVRFSGDDLKYIDRDCLATHFGYVGQNPFVFSGTIAENISYGCLNKSYDEICAAAEMANLHDDVLNVLGGYDAVVAERGNNLSGGQRQRIAIARVLLQQPPILILDEATSALDNISERKIQDALGLGRSQRTTILLAHRLSTLRECNRILVFEKGRIIENGSYEELLEQDGFFASLVASAAERPAPVG